MWKCQYRERLRLPWNFVYIERGGLNGTFDTHIQEQRCTEKRYSRKRLQLYARFIGKRCVRILSEAVASLPLHLYKYTDTGTAKATDHLLYFLLHDEPNPEMTSFVFRETLMTHLLLWGNAYAQIIRNGKGEILALYPLMPDRMNVDRDESGNIVYEYMVSQEDAPSDSNGKKCDRTCYCHRGIRQ